MSRTGLIGILSWLGLMISLTRLAVAGVDPHQPKILLHVVRAPLGNPCTTGFSTTAPNCAGVNTQGDVQTAPGEGPFYFVYLVVAKGDTMRDLAGMQCGLYYDSGHGLPSNGASDHLGLDILGWTLCATLEFPTPSPAWPNPESGNMITWDWTTSCQTGELANAGYFYCAAYSKEFLAIIPRPVDNSASVADCRADVSEVGFDGRGFAGFGVYGCNPCLGRGCEESWPDVPVKETTWGAVKSLSPGR
jgi:hypothetical protein